MISLLSYQKIFTILAFRLFIRVDAGGRTQVISLSAPWQRSLWNPIAESVEIVAKVASLHSNPWILWNYIEDIQSDSVIRSFQSCTDIISKSHDFFTGEAVRMMQSYAFVNLNGLAHLLLTENVYSAAIESDRSIGLGFASVCNEKRTNESGDLSIAAWAVILPDKVIACSTLALTAALSQTCLEKDCHTLDYDIHPSIFPWDHIHPISSETAPLTVILFGAVGSASFHSFHDILVDAARMKRAKYILQHFLPICRESSLEPNESPLHGWGVSLDIKNIEYKNYENGALHIKAENTNFSNDFCKLESLRDIAMGITQDELPKSSASSSSLHLQRMKDIGLQALQTIYDASEPILQLEDISQSFPARAEVIGAIKLRPGLHEEVLKLKSCLLNAGLIPDTLYINGIHASTGTGYGNFDIFQILKQIHVEKSATYILQSLLRDNISLSDARNLLESISANQHSSSNIRIDIIGEKKTVKTGVIYLNDIESEPAYGYWADSLTPLLRPSLQPHFIRRNLITMVLILDIGTTEGAHGLHVASLLSAQVPLRVGVLLASDDEPESNSNVFPGKLLVRTKDVAELLASITELQIARIFSMEVGAALLQDKMNLNMLVEIYIRANVYGGSRLSPKLIEEKAWHVLNEGDYSAARKMFNTVRRAGIPLNSYLINGKFFSSVTDIKDTLATNMMLEQSVLSDLLREGTLKPTTRNVYARLLTAPKLNFIHRYHPAFFDEHPKFLSIFNIKYKSWLASLHWLTSSADLCETYAISVIVSIGRESTKGLRLFASMLEYMNHVNDLGIRVAVIWGEKSMGGAYDGIVKAIQYVHSEMPSSIEGRTFLLQLVSDVLAIENSNVKAVTLSSDDVRRLAEKVQISSQAFTDLLLNWADNLHLTDTENQCNFCLSDGERSFLGFENLNSALYINGRKFSSSNISVEDIEAMVSIEKNYAETLAKGIIPRGHEGECKSNSDDLLRLISFSRIYYNDHRVNVKKKVEICSKNTGKNLELLNSVVKIPGRPDEDLSIYMVLLDPLSLSAQRISTVLRTLNQQLGIPVTLVLTPSTELSELPLKSFYRFSMGSSQVKMTDLPREHVFTQRLDTPSSWIVQPSNSTTRQDLDNLRCEEGYLCGDDNTDVTKARYSLIRLLVTGKCLAPKVTQSSLVQGLQLMLHPSNSGQIPSDTIVMNNFGYFQLKANPGVWNLNLAPGSISDKKFELVYDNELKHNGLIAVRSLSVAPITIHIRERISFDDTYSSEIDSSLTRFPYAIIKSIRSFWSPSAVTNSNSNFETIKRKETIHVFSLASGHLYERFLKVMMLSASRQTDGPIKFWLLENYLTPIFKKDVNILAWEAGFEVGFVTYRWPEWLRAQTEQQRIIWGYKILFLDVLFPLDVQKVIYVDADQVVQSDLRELWEMDLNERVYAFTPFCDSKEEMLEYQFWQGGFWKSHLRGLPYHISALFVVDLDRFRSHGIGDILRGVYMSLSRDPNSLANLDQDLPNYAQHMIPIFSLPQEWLWCETWCSDSSKSLAKTIDICNNPMHKEPKLDMARRVVDGPDVKESWVKLDNEVKEILTKKLKLEDDMS